MSLVLGATPLSDPQRQRSLKSPVEGALWAFIGARWASFTSKTRPRSACLLAGTKLSNLEIGGRENIGAVGRPGDEGIHPGSTLQTPAAQCSLPRPAALAPTTAGP